jgi:hypothetical protein
MASHAHHPRMPSGWGSSGGQSPVLHWLGSFLCVSGQQGHAGVNVTVVSCQPDFRCISAWFARSWLSKSEDKAPIVLLLKYYTYNRGATTQTLSADGPGLIAPGGTIPWGKSSGPS